MNSSLWTADRTTHVKVVVVALIAATVVVVVGARAQDHGSVTAGIETNGPAIKAGKPNSPSGTVQRFAELALSASDVEQHGRTAKQGRPDRLNCAADRAHPVK
jgi:hypothetical protein